MMRFKNILSKKQISTPINEENQAKIIHHVRGPLSTGSSVWQIPLSLTHFTEEKVGASK